ncbi:hypothetical protein D0T85_15300 [Bacteroides sp. 519]|nr:hypothetical protein [Bacteroides sp. 519]
MCLRTEFIAVGNYILFKFAGRTSINKDTMDRKEQNNKLLSYSLIRFVSLPAAVITTVILLIISLYLSVLREDTAFWILLILTGIETIAWLIWGAGTLWKSNKQQRPRLIMINVLIVALYMGFLSMGYELIFGYKLDMTEKSPCGNYTIEVYIPKVRFTMPGDGGLYSNPIRVKLKNNWGWTIDQTPRGREPIYRDAEFRWDYTQRLFWYTKVDCLEF